MGEIWGTTATRCQFFRDVLREKWCEMLGYNFLLRVMVPSTKLGYKQSLHLLVRDAGPKDHWVLSPKSRQDWGDREPFLIISLGIMAKLRPRI